jgi:hypothetical protein
MLKIFKIYQTMTNTFKYALAALGVALTAFLAILGYGAAKKREGASEAAVEAIKADVKKGEKAREKAFREKRDTNGISDSDLAYRVRRRSDDWGSL